MDNFLTNENKNDPAHAHLQDHKRDRAHGQPADLCCEPSPAAAPIGRRAKDIVPGGTSTAIRIMQMDCPTEVCPRSRAWTSIWCSA
jgi:hypothetical protein